VSGVSITAYWFSNLLLDYVKYLLPGIWTMICIVIYDIDAFRKNDHYGASWALMFVYGIVMISFTYLTSFMFKSPSAA
jgi:ATP-binding cassette, subfamily A (ABC1), member 3